MTTVISFPDASTPAIFTFNSSASAEAYAQRLAGCPTFVLGKVDARSLRVLSGPMLVSIYNMANLSEDGFTPVKRLGGSKSQIIERVLPLISGLARPGEVPSSSATENSTMATKKKASKKDAATPVPAEAPKKKAPKAAKEAATTATTKRGRAPDFAGMKLYKTEAGASARRNEASRRSASFAVITNGMKYETALEKGANKDDIIILARLGHIEAREA